MAFDGYFSGGAVGQLIYWLALWEFLRGGGWRPDRSHLFGPAQLVEIRQAATVSTELPALELLRDGMPTPVPVEPVAGRVEL